MGDNLTEVEKQQAQNDLRELQSKTQQLTSKAKETARSLREAANRLDKVWKDCKIARASGNSAGIVGGILTIGGGIATILTAGAATPLLLAGIGVGAAGAGTNLGTSIVEATINSDEIKKAEKDLQKTVDYIDNVNNTIQLWLKRKDKAKLLYICLLAVRTLELSDPVIKILQDVVLSALGLPADIVEVTGKAALELGKSGAHAAGDVAESSAKAGAKAGSKIAGGLIIGVSAAFLVFDAIDLGFTVRDIVKNKGSDAARFLRQKANELDNLY